MLAVVPIVGDNSGKGLFPSHCSRTYKGYPKYHSHEPYALNIRTIIEFFALLGKKKVVSDMLFRECHSVTDFAC